MNYDYGIEPTFIHAVNLKRELLKKLENELDVHFSKICYCTLFSYESL